MYCLIYAACVLITCVYFIPFIRSCIACVIVYTTPLLYVISLSPKCTTLYSWAESYHTLIQETILLHFPAAPKDLVKISRKLLKIQLYNYIEMNYPKLDQTGYSVRLVECYKFPCNSILSTALCEVMPQIIYTQSCYLNSNSIVSLIPSCQ